MAQQDKNLLSLENTKPAVERLSIIIGGGFSNRFQTINGDDNNLHFEDPSLIGKFWNLMALYNINSQFNFGAFYSNYWTKKQLLTVYPTENNTNQLPTEIETKNTIGYISFILNYRFPSLYEDKVWLTIGSSIGEINYHNDGKTTTLKGHNIGFGLHGHLSYMINKNIGIIVNTNAIFGKLKEADFHTGHEITKMDLSILNTGNVGRIEFGFGMIFSLFHR